MPGSLTSLRREFPHTRHGVFFDHASFGPISRRARILLDQLADRFQHLDPTIDGESFRLIRQLAHDFGRLIGARRGEVSFQPNTTTGIMHVFHGLELKAGERIILPEVEFPTLTYAVKSLAEHQGLTVDYLPCPDGYLNLENLERALAKKTIAVVALSWVQYFNGYRYDLLEVADLCHRYGAFVLIDAIQGGGVVPLNVRRCGIDALACGGQKWMLSQMGTGWLYVNRDSIRPVRPPIIGWLGVDWGISWNHLQGHDQAFCSDGRQFEGGTYPYYNLRLAEAGLGLIREAGVSRTYRHASDLLDQLRGFLADSPWSINLDVAKKHRSGILSFSGPGIAALHAHLRKNNFHVSFREGSIRVSPHFYNTPTEMRQFISTARKFLH